MHLCSKPLARNEADCEVFVKGRSLGFEGIISLLLYFLNCPKALFTKK